jgi:hypothetical protein
MMAKTPEMDPNFAAWYAQVFMDEGTTRAARWKGVVDTAAAANYQMVEVLLRLAFASGAPSGTKNETLEESYRAVLATISGDGKPVDPTTSRRELQVLAAAVLVRLFAWMSDAALGVTTTSFNSARKPDLPMDLVGLAHRALHDLSHRNHGRPEVKELEVPAPKVEFEVSEEAMGSFDQTTWKGELGRLRDANRVATRSIVEGQNRVVKLLSRQVALGNEELQMLWWLIGEQSAVARKPFGKVESALRPLAFGKELGRMTTISPGPASVVAMLSRAGVADKGMKVQDAVNAVDLQWAKEVTSSTSISPISTPLHFALEKRAEIGNDEAWQALWAAMTGFAADASLPAIRLAELFYREHLYLHVAA